MATSTSTTAEVEVDPNDILKGDLVHVRTSRWETAERAWEWEDDHGSRHIALKLVDFYWPIHIDAYRDTKLTVRRRQKGN